MPNDERRFLQTILDAAPGMIAYWDKNLRCRHANRAYLDWFGIAPEKVIGMHMPDLLGERLFELNKPYILGALAGAAQRFERTLTKADGSIGYTLANYVPDRDENGSVAGFSVLVSDVTPLKLAELQTMRARARLRAVLDSVADGIFTVEPDWSVSSMNPAGLRMFGYHADEIVGKRLDSLIIGHPQGFAGAVAAQLPPLPPELTGVRSDGHRFPVELQIRTVETLDEKLLVGVVRDVTVQRQLQDQLTQLALADGLTGLANRRRFDDVLAMEFHAHMRSAEPLSLLMVDVDYFKQFNDRYGHLAGDACLRQVAAAIRRVVVRATDLAARYGGEEFACILPMTDPAGAAAIAGQIQQAVARLGIAHESSRAASHVTVSIGVATARCTGSISPDCIIRLADAQLYSAKSHGRNRAAAAQLAGAGSC